MVHHVHIYTTKISTHVSSTNLYCDQGYYTTRLWLALCKRMNIRISHFSICHGTSIFWRSFAWFPSSEYVIKQTRNATLKIINKIFVEILKHQTFGFTPFFLTLRIWQCAKIIYVSTHSLRHFSIGTWHFIIPSTIQHTCSIYLLKNPDFFTSFFFDNIFMA